MTSHPETKRYVKSQCETKRYVKFPSDARRNANSNGSETPALTPEMQDQSVFFSLQVSSLHLLLNCAFVEEGSQKVNHWAGQGRRRGAGDRRDERTSQCRTEIRRIMFLRRHFIRTILGEQNLSPEPEVKPSVHLANSLVTLIIIIFINCNWVVTRWQWLFYMYTKHEIGYY